MMQQHDVLRTMRKAYGKMIDDGHDANSDYMCEFSLVIQEQPMIYRVLADVSDAMDSIASMYVHTR